MSSNKKAHIAVDCLSQRYEHLRP